jgi:hypothetical protein
MQDAGPFRRRHQRDLRSRMTRSDMTGGMKDRLTGSEGSVPSRALADCADDVCLRPRPLCHVCNETRQCILFEAMAAAILAVVLMTGSLNRAPGKIVHAKRDFN